MNIFMNNIKTVLLMGGLSALLMGAGHLIGGMQGVTIALIMAGVMNFIGFFFSDKIALASVRAQEVGPDHPLHRMVARLAERSNMPMPRVYISPEQAPNAFATGRSPKHSAVCATEGLLQVLNQREVEGVMAHELAHIKHRDVLISTLAATFGAAISYIGYMAMFMGSSDDEEQSPLAPIAGLLILILGPVAALIIQMAVSRQREYAADTLAAQMTGDAMPLATALEKIHALAHRVPMHTTPAMNNLMIAEPKNFAGQMASLFSTHPPLEKRVMNLIGRENTGLIASRF